MSDIGSKLKVLIEVAFGGDRYVLLWPKVTTPPIAVRYACTHMQVASQHSRIEAGEVPNSL